MGTLGGSAVELLVAMTTQAALELGQVQHTCFFSERAKEKSNSSSVFRAEKRRPVD